MNHCGFYFVQLFNFILQLTNDMIILIGAVESTACQMEIELKKIGSLEYIMPPKHVKLFDDDKYFRPCLEITPQVGCSINCHYCPQKKFLEKYFVVDHLGVMPFAEFKKCIDKTPNNTIIEFAGFVEPFLHSAAVDMMEYVCKTGREMTLFTTLVGLDQKKCQRIISLPFRQVVLHLPDQDGYATIPMTKEYFALLDMVLNAKRSDGKNFVDSANCQSVLHTDIESFLKGRVMVSGVMVDRAGNLVGNSLLSGGNYHDPIYCNRADQLNHNVLLPNGDVVLCCMDFGLKHVLGNLFNETYEDILNGENMRYIRHCMGKSIATGDILCRQCTSGVAFEQSGNMSTP